MSYQDENDPGATDRNYIDCKRCEGTGRIVIDDNLKPTSCSEKCLSCNGEGEIEIDNDEEFDYKFTRDV